ncbi:hypothetical protein HCG64_00140 [Coprobacillus sp. K06]|jgi:DNA-directed RNA polymerase specialized sigma24 family protein|uniref:RNA polymerase sigma factor n=1 Tax=Coprobacillus sp. K06 TaxID=2718930 RepID=UPI001C8B9B2D|nr:sigma-70 region 4 domain-containing protein [Coprobacillus sp. K06]MBX9163515.1 hypothetical protein [Coprobacillus sp. K06]
MTIDETRTFLKSYKSMANRVEYINNKMINVKSIRYDDTQRCSYGEPKTQNDYIIMKDEYLSQMQEIKDSIERLSSMTYRNILFYRYIECLSVYDIAEIMDYSPATVRTYILDAVKELSVIM